MVLVQVGKLLSGDQLLEDVYTQRGSKLFHKGKVLTDRDIEVLKAFMVVDVIVDRSSSRKVDTHHADQETRMPRRANVRTRIESETSAESSVSKQETGQHEPGKKTESLAHGKSFFRPEPPVGKVFEYYYEQLFQITKQIFNHSGDIDKESIAELRRALEAIIPRMDYMDVLSYVPSKLKVGDHVYHKGIMVSLISYIIARWTKLPRQDLMPIALAGLLHDIGNMAIDPAILNKPGPLTPEEMEIVKKHTIIGYNKLKNLPVVNEGVKLAALQHHEREDGSGYPLGLKGSTIHTFSKVVAVADIFYAMTRTSRYKNGRALYVVLEQLYQDSFGKLDPKIVQPFIHNNTQHQLGYTVRLNDGSVGKIVYSDHANPTRPWVNVKGKIINLALERHLHIAEIISRKVE